VLGTYDSDICCEYLPKILAKARRNSMAELSTPAKVKNCDQPEVSIKYLDEQVCNFYLKIVFFELK
jgi:hypothetical protein